MTLAHLPANLFSKLADPRVHFSSPELPSTPNATSCPCKFQENMRPAGNNDQVNVFKRCLLVDSVLVLGMTATHLGSAEALEEFQGLTGTVLNVYRFGFTKRESVEARMTVCAEPICQLNIGWLAVRPTRAMLQRCMECVNQLHNQRAFSIAAEDWARRNGKRNFVHFYCSLASAVVYSLVIEELRAAPNWACFGSRHPEDPPPYHEGLKELSPWQNTLVLTNDYRNLVLSVSLLLEIRGRAADFVRAQWDQIQRLRTSFDRLAREETEQRGLQPDPTPDLWMEDMGREAEGLADCCPQGLHGCSTSMCSLVPVVLQDLPRCGAQARDSELHTIR